MWWFSDGRERRSRQDNFGVTSFQRLASHVHQQLLCAWTALLQARSPSIHTDPDPCPKPSCKRQCWSLSLCLSSGEKTACNTEEPEAGGVNQSHHGPSVLLSLLSWGGHFPAELGLPRSFASWAPQTALFPHTPFSPSPAPFQSLVFSSVNLIVFPVEMPLRSKFSGLSPNLGLDP